MQKKWYQRNWLIIALLFILPPASAGLVWTTQWKRWAKIAVTIWGVLVLGGAILPSSDEPELATTQETTEETSVDNEAASDSSEAGATLDTTATSLEDSPATEAASETKDSPEPQESTEASEDSKVESEVPDQSVEAEPPVTSEEATSPNNQEESFETALAQFKNAMGEIDPNQNIVVKIEPGIVEGEAKITVSNAWFYEPKQIRLQAAQNLWNAWATIYSPDPIDTARIRLVDGNDNKVGGSRTLAGSMIYVDD